jgi:hypothetical protein
MTKEWGLQDNMTSAETIVQMMFSSMPDPLKQSLVLSNPVKSKKSFF